MPALVFLLRIVHLLLYFLLAAQGGFYLLGFGTALLRIPVIQFITLRQAVHQVIERPLKVLYLSALVWSLAMPVLQYRTAGRSSCLLCVLAACLLLTDIILARKVAEPLNHLTGIMDGTEPHAALLRRKWLWQIRCRGLICLSGFIALLAAYLLAS